MRDSQRFAAATEAAGFDGLWMTEGGRTAYLGCTAAILATTSLDIGTGVAVAFPRSPMITASTAWELAEASTGRFALGLGTQVRAHVVRRYSSAFDPARTATAGLRPCAPSDLCGLPGRHQARLPRSLLQLRSPSRDLSPGPIDAPAPPIYLAAVRPWMLQLCGEVADGVHVHPLHSRRYLDEVVRPNVAVGAARTGRDPADVRARCARSIMTITGDTDAELESWRIRTHGAARVLRVDPRVRPHVRCRGVEGTGEKLNQLMRTGDMAALSATITDDMLDAYAVTATWDRLADALVDPFRGSADRVICYFVGSGWRDDPRVLERWAEVTAGVQARLREDV